MPRDLVSIEKCRRDPYGKERQKEKIDTGDAEARRELPGGERLSERGWNKGKKAGRSGYPLVQTDVMKQTNTKKSCKSHVTEATSSEIFLL